MTPQPPLRPNRPKVPLPQGQRLAWIGLAGESVGILAGAAGWRFSGEPLWLIMSIVSLAFALLFLRRV